MPFVRDLWKNPLSHILPVWVALGSCAPDQSDPQRRLQQEEYMPSQGQGYALIGIDQMEAAVVRRRLMNLQKQGVMELVSQLQRNDLLSDAKIRDPRYETNVWPLYYYWTNISGLEARDVYVKTVETVQQHFGAVPDHLVPKWVEIARFRPPSTHSSS